MAGILARMEALDLVLRERLEHDQRRQLVTPTASSRALAQRIAPRIDAEYKAIEAQLESALVGSLVSTLDQVIARLGPSAEAAEDGA